MSCSAKFKNKLVGDIVRGVREGLDPPPPPRGYGICHHNLQPIMELKDFTTNRATDKPSSKL